MKKFGISEFQQKAPNYYNLKALEKSAVEYEKYKEEQKILEHEQSLRELEKDITDLEKVIPGEGNKK